MALHGIAAVSPIWEMANPSSPLPLQQIPPPPPLPSRGLFLLFFTGSRGKSGTVATLLEQMMLKKLDLTDRESGE